MLLLLLTLTFPLDTPTTIYVDRIDFVARLQSEGGPVYRKELYGRNWDGPRQVKGEFYYEPGLGPDYSQWMIPHALYVDFVLRDVEYRSKETSLGVEVRFRHHDREYLIIARDTACMRTHEDCEALDAAIRPRHYRRGLPWSRDGKTIYFQRD